MLYKFYIKNRDDDVINAIKRANFAIYKGYMKIPVKVPRVPPIKDSDKYPQCIVTKPLELIQKTKTHYTFSIGVEHARHFVNTMKSLGIEFEPLVI